MVCHAVLCCKALMNQDLILAKYMNDINVWGVVAAEHFIF